MIVKKHRFFPPWREAEQEQWLQEMSRQGLHFVDVDMFGNHSFELGPPQDWVYRWSVLTNRETEHYKQLYRDAGWEVAAVTVGFICWRKLAAKGQTEVFTDSAAKRRQKLQHAFWLGIGAAFCAIAAAGGPNANDPFSSVLLRAALAIWLGYAAVRLGWQARNMGKKP